jgi:hypothetical protein
LIGIYDFSCAPYALGDVITFQENLSIKAIQNDDPEICLYLILDPAHPSFPPQPYITKNNYVDYFQNLFPAFLCLPQLGSIHIIRDRRAFNRGLLKRTFPKHSTWPSVWDYFIGKLDFSSHKTVNLFFRENKYIPKLAAPKGYEGSIENLLQRKREGRFFVTVSIRQRALYPDIGFSKADDFAKRDSPAREWSHFFNEVAQDYPDVFFILLGGFSEWERKFHNFSNVIIPKANGFGLGDQLALIHGSDLFMGTSSGFAAMATFSKTPYIITNYEHSMSEQVELPVGALNYPFASEHQILSWERESSRLLLDLFVPIYKELKGRSGK